MKHSRIAVCLAALAALLAPAMIASPASAAPPRANCVSGDLGDHCIFWGQNYDGSHTGVSENVSNFPVSGSTSYKFLSSGSGKGQYIGNNNGSDRNLDTGCEVFLYYHANQTGPVVVLSVYQRSGYQKKGTELGALLNNIRSQAWVC